MRKGVHNRIIAQSNSILNAHDETNAEFDAKFFGWNARAHRKSEIVFVKVNFFDAQPKSIENISIFLIGIDRTNE